MPRLRVRDARLWRAGPGRVLSCWTLLMPMLIDTITRTGSLVRAINWLLADGGPRALSLRSIGRTSRVSPSSILHHYGKLDQLLRVAAHWTARARHEAIAARSRDGAAASLPATDDDVVDARVWLAWAELWRSDPALEVVFDECRQEERALLAKVTDYRFSRQGLDTLTALIDGLTTAVCAPRHPMPPARARELLAGWLAAQPE